MEEEPLAGQDFYIDVGYPIFPNYLVNQEWVLDLFL